MDGAVEAARGPLAIHESLGIALGAKVRRGQAGVTHRSLHLGTEVSETGAGILLTPPTGFNEGILQERPQTAPPADFDYTKNGGVDRRDFAQQKDSEGREVLQASFFSFFLATF
jgi:hypothetical protein